MERWLKSGREERGRGQRAAGTDSEASPGHFLCQHHHSGHVRAPCLALLGRARLSGVRGRGLDLVALRRTLTWSGG